MGAIALVCGCAGDPNDPAAPEVGAFQQASSGTCPVTVDIPFAGQIVGPAIQPSVTQSCQNWTNAMIIYIDNVDCASGSYAYPNAGCHTDNGVQNFPQGQGGLWVQVTPGYHTIVVNNWNSQGTVGVSTANRFCYEDGSGVCGGGGGHDPVLAGAGDIGMPGTSMGATGNLVRAINPDYVFTLGDNAYGNTANDQGSATSYANYYDPYWGSFIGKTLPNPGNHDYGNWDLNVGGHDGAGRVMSGYYNYFNGRVVPGLNIGSSATTLHYGFDIYTASGKKWRWISVDSGFCFYTPSNCSINSSEFAWLQSELAGHNKTNGYVGLIMATHFDRYESQECGGSNTQVDPFVALAHDYHVDLYLAGHVHSYERYCQLAKYCGSTTQANCGANSCGPVCDPAGPVEINVGTGGADNAGAGENDAWAASRKRIVSAPGVLKLTLHDTSWDFAYLNTSSQVLDSGSYAVH